MTMVYNKSVSGQAAQPIALAGGYWMLIGTLTVSASYAAGGDTLDLTPFFPAGKTIRECVILSPIRSLNAEYDVTNKKLKLWTINPAAATSDVAPVELAAAAYDADLTGSAIPFVAIMKG
jgi:hypothetical protein